MEQHCERIKELTGRPMSNSQERSVKIRDTRNTTDGYNVYFCQLNHFDMPQLPLRKRVLPITVACLGL